MEISGLFFLIFSFFSSFHHVGNMQIAATHLASDQCHSAAWCNKATLHCVTVLCWAHQPCAKQGRSFTYKLFSCMELKLGPHWEGFKAAALLGVSSCGCSWPCGGLSLCPALPRQRLGSSYTRPPSQHHVPNLVSAHSTAALGLMGTPTPAAPSSFFFSMLFYSNFNAGVEAISANQVGTEGKG